MIGVYTTNDMHLRNPRTLHLPSTLLNLVKSQAPSIGIAQTTTKRTELAVKDTDVRRLDMYVAVVVDKLSARSSFAAYSKLAKQPQRRMTPQRNGILCC